MTTQSNINSSIINASTNKQLDFWYRARKQYEGAQKPFTYEFNLLSTQPKPKKFMIIVNKFIDILKQDLKQQYSSEQQLKDNYWNQLQKYYKDQYQMSYIIQTSYQKKKNMLKLYFCLLLHNKKIFQQIKEITQKMDYMYRNPKQKLNNLEKLFENVEYLKDGQYNIMSDFIAEFMKYEEKKIFDQRLKQKLAEKEKKEREERERKQREERQMKEQKQKKEREDKQRLEEMKRQKEQKQRKQALQRQKQAKQKQRKKVQPQNQQQKNQLTPLDQSINFIPASYKAQNIQDKSNTLIYPPKDNKVNQQWLNRNQNNNKKHKNSQLLYELKYKDEFQVFTFRMDPQIDSKNIQRNKDVCYECGKELKQGFYIFGGNQNQCTYTGEWFCNQHMAEERISISWKALKSFDLKGYPVSIKAYCEIKSYYQKPIIQIRNDNPVLKHSRILYQFLVLKRQIHLMYDSICDLQLMQPLLKKKLNYCLKQNLFSLKNLYDIYNGHQTPSLQRQYNILSKHFFRCQLCQKRKGYVCGKCKDPVKIFAFQLQLTFGCINCKKLYHKSCLTNGKCDCQDQ